MRADKLYEAVLALLGEEDYSCSDFVHLRFRIINHALAMCLSTHNTSLAANGKSKIEAFKTIVSPADEIPTSEAFAREVLVPLAAALLISDHDRDKANLLFEMSERAKSKYSKVNFKNIINSY